MTCTCRPVPDHKGELDFEIDPDCIDHGVEAQRDAVGEDAWSPS